MASSTAETRGRPVFVLTGTSGEGKSTLAKLLVERVPALELAISATTRPQRPNEQDGRDYWFLTHEEFDRRLEEGGFLEWVELPWGESYRSGTLWSELERITGTGMITIESRPIATVDPETITERPACVIVSTTAVSTSRPCRSSSLNRKIISSA